MLVSVIIPTYNRAATIERAVNSVLNQTWKQQEIIVVDDGSTDPTIEVLSKYGETIKLVRQKNAGPSAARNAGIRAAKGELISFLDSDDSWLPEKTERQVKLLKAAEIQGVKCCVCNANMKFPDREITSFAVANLWPERQEGIWNNPAEVLVSRFLFFNQVVAVRREALEQVGLFREDMRIMEDYDLALRLSAAGKWGFIADPLVVWHSDSEGSLSRSLTQLDKTVRAYSILEELSKSPSFGPVLKGPGLRRRLQFLRQTMAGQRLCLRRGPVARIAGKLLLVFTQAAERVRSRLGGSPRMRTSSI